ncbi:MAG TPA: hypothetical protein DEB06_04960 [Phycisphaerales bacterium]|nr:hypothetical protein [Phycisphaerales bacterium]
MTALSSSSSNRSPWRDRFRAPTLEELRRACAGPEGGLLESARDHLLATPGVQEEVAWQGLPWRWTLVYSAPADATRAWAYLVPDPAKPVLAVPITEEMVLAFPMDRLKKHVRDGVLTSRKVAGVYWATWELTSKAQLGEILELVDRKRKFFLPKK